MEQEYSQLTENSTEQKPTKVVINVGADVIDDVSSLKKQPFYLNPNHCLDHFPDHISRTLNGDFFFRVI